VDDRHYSEQRRWYDRLSQGIHRATLAAMLLTFVLTRDQGRLWVFWTGATVTFILLIADMALYAFIIDPMVSRQLKKWEVDEHSQGE